MNRFQTRLLELARDTAYDWEFQFESMPIVYVGVGRPMHRLTDTEKEIAHTAVSIFAAVADVLVQRYGAFD